MSTKTGDTIHIQVHDRVKIRTMTRGCYHGKTGTVTRVLNGAMTPIDVIPEGSPNRFPYWYQVQLDAPADNGGVPVRAEIFMASELTVMPTRKGGKR